MDKRDKNRWVKGDTTMLIQQRKTSLHEVFFSFFSSPILFSIFPCVFFLPVWLLLNQGTTRFQAIAYM